MKKVILLCGLLIGLLATSGAYADHHEEAATDSTKCEYAKKECHGDWDQSKCAKWKEGKRHGKYKGHHKGKRGCGKLFYILVLAAIFGGIGYFCGRKCGKCSCCCKKE
jgi:hypothetical protein